MTKCLLDAGERAALYQLVGLNEPSDSIGKEDARLYDAALERGREARFRLTTVPAYNDACALQAAGVTIRKMPSHYANTHTGCSMRGYGR
jgi:hypothetical protein